MDNLDWIINVMFGGCLGFIMADGYKRKHYEIISAGVVIFICYIVRLRQAFGA